MTCPCCGLTGPHKNMSDGCIPALRTRVAELEAERETYRNGMLKAAECIRKDEHTTAEILLRRVLIDNA